MRPEELEGLAAGVVGGSRDRMEGFWILGVVVGLGIVREGIVMVVSLVLEAVLV